MRLLFIVPVLLCAQLSFAQSGRAGGRPAIRPAADSLPSWAAKHNYNAASYVYFPDYYTFYDPRRKGYYYWENGEYKFTPAVPPFLEKVDLSRSRIQVLKGLSLDLHPERNYPYYMKMYPAQPGNSGVVPVPIPGNPAAH